MSLVRQLKRKNTEAKQREILERACSVAFDKGAQAQMEKLTLAMVNVLDRLEEVDDIGKIRASKIRLFFWNEIGR